MLNHKRSIVILAGATLFSAVQPTLADHPRRHHRRYSGVEADIERFDARLHHGRGGSSLNVRYEVEIEDAHLGQRFDLVIHATQHGRPLLDGHGRPMVFIAPLEYPVEIDDDEVTFESSFAVQLPYHTLHSPRSLRLHATVVPRGSNIALDDEDTYVKTPRGGRRRGGFHLSFWRNR